MGPATNFRRLVLELNYSVPNWCQTSFGGNNIILSVQYLMSKMKYTIIMLDFFPFEFLFGSKICARALWKRILGNCVKQGPDGK